MSQVYNVRPGDEIGNICCRMLELADKTGEVVTATFNGDPLTTEGCKTVDEVYGPWWSIRDKRHKESERAAARATAIMEHKARHFGVLLAAAEAALPYVTDRETAATIREAIGLAKRGVA